MKRQKIIAGVSILFFLLLAILLWALLGNRAAESEVGTIAFLTDGEEIAQVDMEYMKRQESKTFKAVIRSSGKKPQEAEYTGVLLAKMLSDQGISLEGKEQVIVKGTDGYMTAVSSDELDKVYIAYAMDGEDLKTKRRGGNGPYQLVILNDPFSQRWCKYVYEVEVK